MRGRPVPFVGLTLAAVVVAVGAVLVSACAGTTNADVTTARSGGSSTTAAPGSPGGETTTTGQPQATIPPPGSTGNGQAVTIAFGGDIHYDGTLMTTLQQAPDTMLAGVKPVIDAADLTVVNLETAITEGGDRQGKAFTFKAPPAALDALKANGVDVIGMANNHALDYGQAGLQQTLAAIRERDAPVIGVGANEDEAYRPFVAEVKGQRIAIIAASQVLDGSLVGSWTATAAQGGVASAKRVDRLSQEVAKARNQANTVVVFVHWGTEGQYCPNPEQETLARQLVDAGADLVVGGHAHRVQSGGYLGNAYVEYGLGNFQFKAGSVEGREGGMLAVTVTGRRVDSATWHPVLIGTDYLPDLMSEGSANAALGRWNSRRACAKLADAPPGATPAPAGATTTTTTTTP